MKDKFISFLKENDCFDEFEKYLKEDGFHESTESYIESGDATKIDLVSSAFYWSVTEQGHEYWSNMSKKWQNEIM